MTPLVSKLKDLAPYAVIMLLPGGSLVALVFWFLRREKAMRVFADFLN